MGVKKGFVRSFPGQGNKSKERARKFLSNAVADVSIPTRFNVMLFIKGMWKWRLLQADEIKTK